MTPKNRKAWYGRPWRLLPEYGQHGKSVVEPDRGYFHVRILTDSDQVYTLQVSSIFPNDTLYALDQALLALFIAFPYANIYPIEGEAAPLGVHKARDNEPRVAITSVRYGNALYTSHTVSPRGLTLDRSSYLLYMSLRRLRPHRS